MDLWRQFRRRNDSTITNNNNESANNEEQFIYEENSDNDDKDNNDDNEEEHNISENSEMESLLRRCWGSLTKCKIFQDNDQEVCTRSGRRDLQHLVSTTSGHLVINTLHRMAREGDVEALQSILVGSGEPLLCEVRSHINDLDNRQLAPLHYASRYSNVALIKLLVKDFGADVDVRGYDQMTPLHFCARYGKKSGGRQAPSPFRSRGSPSLAEFTEPYPEFEANNEENNEDETNESEGKSSELNGESIRLLCCTNISGIRQLIRLGADQLLRDKYGLTALHHAAMRGNVEGAKQLLRLVNEVDNQLSRPLHLAATYDHLEVLKLLLEAGANPGAVDADGRTALHDACRNGNLDVTKCLIEFTDNFVGTHVTFSMIRQRDREGSTPFLLAVSSGRTSIVNELLARGSSPNEHNDQMQYALHAAARTGDLMTVKTLVENGAVLDRPNLLSETPLYLAASSNHVGTIAFLISRGADANLMDASGITPIMAAAMEGHLESVNKLIELNARLDLLDDDDRSVLFHAANENKHRVVELLLGLREGRLLAQIPDRHDSLPLHIASSQGHVTVVSHLLRNCGETQTIRNEDEQTALHLAALNGHLDVLELLLHQDPNAVMDEDEENNTPLHLASINGHYRVVQKLLEQGADVQKRNAKQWTPLDCAAAFGDVKVVQALLQYDAPLDPLDRSHTTPLHLAAEMGHEQVVALLLRSGANISMEDAHQRNVLELALLSRKRHVVSTILANPHWRRAMRTTCTVHDAFGHPVPETPMRLLLRIYPDLAATVLDKCISHVDNNSNEKSDFNHYYRDDFGGQIKLEYEFIDDSFFIRSLSDLELAQNRSKGARFAYFVGNKYKSERKFFEEPYDNNGKVRAHNHPLMAIANQGKNGYLLRHPLCTALIRLKWRTFARYVYYFQLLNYCLFLASLTTFIFHIPRPEKIDGVCTVQPWPVDNEAKKIGTKVWVASVSKLMIVCFVVVNIIFEIIQWFRAGRRYFEWTNLFDWLVYLSTAAFVFDLSHLGSSNGTGITKCWHWEVGVSSVVLAWLNLLGDIRQLPLLGIYIIMFFDVLNTFLKFFAAFLVFIVAFGLGFHLLVLPEDHEHHVTYKKILNNITPFSDTLFAMLKTSVMTIGEFEYDTLFFESSPLFPISTTLLFVVFLIVMAIIIMNLLVGLAVDDIKAVQEQAILKRLSMKVQLILDVERMLPNRLLHFFNTKSEVLRINASKSLGVLHPDYGAKRSAVAQVVGQTGAEDDDDAVSGNLSHQELLSSLHEMNEQLRRFCEEQSEMRVRINDIASTQIYILNNFINKKDGKEEDELHMD